MLAVKMLAKASTAIFVRLKIIFAIELERVFLKNKTKHFSEVLDWNGRLVILKTLVCLAYRGYALFLWYVCVEASDVH